jgi:hypothetical protein
MRPIEYCTNASWLILSFILLCYVLVDLFLWEKNSLTRLFEPLLRDVWPFFVFYIKSSVLQKYSGLRVLKGFLKSMNVPWIGSWNSWYCFSMVCRVFIWFNLILRCHWFSFQLTPVLPVYNALTFSPLTSVFHCRTTF